MIVLTPPVEMSQIPSARTRSRIRKFAIQYCNAPNQEERDKVYVRSRDLRNVHPNVEAVIHRVINACIINDYQKVADIIRIDKRELF